MPLQQVSGEDGRVGVACKCERERASGGGRRLGGWSALQPTQRALVTQAARGCTWGTRVQSGKERRGWGGREPGLQRLARALAHSGIGGAAAGGELGVPGRSGRQFRRARGLLPQVPGPQPPPPTRPRAPGPASLSPGIGRGLQRPCRHLRHPHSPPAPPRPPPARPHTRQPCGSRRRRSRAGGAPAWPPCSPARSPSCGSACAWSPTGTAGAWAAGGARPAPAAPGGRHRPPAAHPPPAAPRPKPPVAREPPPA